MVGAVITLPLRIGMRAAWLATRPAAALLHHVLGGEESEVETWAQPEPPPVRPRRPVRFEAGRAEPEPGPEAQPAARSEPAASPPPPPLVEDHVSEEVELVADSADPDATETPGPEITVDEPWPGYRRAKAAEVISSLPDVSFEELAVIQLYESTHRRRKTVLEAIEHQLKVPSPPPGANGHAS